MTIPLYAQRDHRELGRELLTTPGITLRFAAQKRDDTGVFQHVSLFDAEAETFTHYLYNEKGERADEVDYYNSFSYAEETRTLGEQEELVRGRFHQGYRVHRFKGLDLRVGIEGTIAATAYGGVPKAIPSLKDGWETPLNWYLDQVGLDRKQVLREILAFVHELPENHTARVAVLETNIQELSEE